MTLRILRSSISILDAFNDVRNNRSLAHDNAILNYDEALLIFRQHADDDSAVKNRRLNPMQAIDRATLNPAASEVADALELLRQLHVGRNHRPIAQTMADHFGLPELRTLVLPHPIGGTTPARSTAGPMRC